MSRSALLAVLREPLPRDWVAVTSSEPDGRFKLMVWRVALFVAEVVALCFACLAVHELGHATAAKALGFSDVRIRLRPPVGTTYVGERRRLRLAAVAAAGSAANFAVGGLVMACSHLGAPSNGWAFVAPWFLLITGVVNLVPVPQSDGWQLLLLAVGRPVGSAERPVEPRPEDTGL